MLNWLRRRLGWSRDQYATFRFWDGRRWRAVATDDAVVAFREQFADMKATVTDFAIDLHVCRGKGLALLACRSTGEIVDATRRAFGIRPLEQGGLSVAETLLLFNDLLRLGGNRRQFLRAAGVDWPAID